MAIDISKMPKLGFGMMRLPKTNDKIDLDAVCGMVDACMRAGMNYFDTAYIYHGGESEDIVRQAVVERYPRDSFMLADKLPQWVMKGADDRDRILNEQLRRLGTDHLDVYLLHDVHDGASYENYLKYDCFSWLRGVKAQGRAKHIGFSYHGTPELLDEILSAHPEIEIVQMQLNYADWDDPVVQAGRVHEVLCRHGLPIIVMEPVKGGNLAALVDAEAEMLKAAAPDVSIASWALRFAASQKNVVTVLSGMSTPAQVQDNLRTFGSFEPLNADEAAVIERVRAHMKTIPTIPCTGCRYCTDGCPQKIDIPEIFSCVNRLRRFGDTQGVRTAYAQLAQNGARAADCVACDQCQSVCPQHLPVPELLSEASAAFDS